MKINKNKSGIMFLSKRRLSNYPSGEFEGYPFVKCYRYLGTELSYDMKIDGHLNYILKKSSYVMAKLKMIRIRNNLKLNINLFKVFISPLFRLLGDLYAGLKEFDRKKVSGLFKRLFKTFCMFPTILRIESLRLFSGILM